MICPACFEDTDVVEGRTWCCGLRVGHPIRPEPVGPAFPGWRAAPEKKEKP